MKGNRRWEGLTFIIYIDETIEENKNLKLIDPSHSAVKIGIVSLKNDDTKVLRDYRNHQSYHWISK